MSELKYSKTGIPYIELVDGENTFGNLIFSRITSTSAGYKYFCFSHKYSNLVCSKKGNGKNATRQFTEVMVNDSYTFDFKFKRDESGKKGVPQGMMPRRLVEWVKDFFAEFLVDGIIPYSAVKLMEPIIAELDIDRVLVTDADRVREANKEAKTQARLDKVAAEEKAELEEQIIRDDYKATNRKDAIEAESVKQKVVPLSEIF